MTSRSSLLRKSLKVGITAAAALALTGCLSVMPVMAPKAKNVQDDISGEFPFTSKFVDVNGSQMHYVEQGEGAPIILVHGNPTSSYLWRNIIPGLSAHGRVIAVDLIGMGKSDKPDIDYRFASHAEYFEGFVEALDLADVTLVLHDWGGGIGLDYAASHPENVKAIALMEAVMKPMRWEDADFATRYLFGKFRDKQDGPRINGERNYFVTTLLPMMTGRKLTEEESAAYQAPYPTVESRKPVVQWPMEIPISGAPADNAERIGSNYEWLKTSDTPLLLLTAKPGLIVNKNLLAELQEDLPRMEVKSIGSGLHYIQEVQPERITYELSLWLSRAPQK